MIQRRFPGSVLIAACVLFAHGPAPDARGYAKFTIRGRLSAPALRGGSLRLVSGTRLQPVIPGQEGDEALVFQTVTVCDDVKLEIGPDGLSQRFKLEAICTAPGVPPAKKGVAWKVLPRPADPNPCGSPVEGRKPLVSPAWPGGLVPVWPCALDPAQPKLDCDGVYDDFLRAHGIQMDVRQCEDAGLCFRMDFLNAQGNRIRYLRAKLTLSVPGHPPLEEMVAPR